MASDHDILQAVQQAFSGCPRPEHFTHYTHCAECAEHDELLRSRDIDTLVMEDVGNWCWDPICFISEEGFLYYLPALARLALEESVDTLDWYGCQLLSHLCSDGQNNLRFLACTEDQRRTVCDFLRHLVETRAATADNSFCADDLLQALEIWSSDHGP